MNARAPTWPSTADTRGLTSQQIQLVDVLRRHPGSTFDELAERSGLGRHGCHVWLASLATMRIVRRTNGDERTGAARWVLADPGRQFKAAPAKTEKPAPKPPSRRCWHAIVEWLQEEEEAMACELAVQTGFSRATVSFALQAMQQRGQIQKEGRLWRLTKGAK